MRGLHAPYKNALKYKPRQKRVTYHRSRLSSRPTRGGFCSRRRALGPPPEPCLGLRRPGRPRGPRAGQGAGGPESSWLRRTQTAAGRRVTGEESQEAAGSPATVRTARAGVSGPGGPRPGSRPGVPTGGQKGLNWICYVFFILSIFFKKTENVGICYL